MHRVTVARGRTLIGRLKKGDDLLESLTLLCSEANVRLGKVQAIGAVSKSAVGFYLQETKEYTTLNYDCHQEIVSLQGNISTKDGEPFVHAHLALSDSHGGLHGGHLMPGTVVFACEYIINEYISETAEIKNDLEDQTFSRTYDDETGLHLWPKERIVP